MDTVLKTDFANLKLLARGKVRDIYDLDDKLLIISTDRVSAFDIVLPNGISSKGKTLTKISEFWFNFTSPIIKNHLITTDIDLMPAECKQYKDILEGRSMLVHKAKPLPVEAIVRGYITGSGWKDYKSTGMISGIKLPPNLLESEKFDSPLFTPSTKAEVGEHDVAISYDQVVDCVGPTIAEQLKTYSLEIYNKAAEFALTKGIILADTKFEFGTYNDEIILIDEVLTPDSSRFWSAEKYKIGQGQDSMDKQVIRDYLESTDWDKTDPAPQLPESIINKAKEKYELITNLLLAD